MNPGKFPKIPPIKITIEVPFEIVWLIISGVGFGTYHLLVKNPELLQHLLAQAL